MERKIYLFGFLMSFLCVACNKSDMEYENDYEKSYKSWRSFKKSSNNSYRYVVSGYAWEAATWKTELIVQQGEVIERHFYYTSYLVAGMPDGGWNLPAAQRIVDSLEARNTYGGDRELTAEELLEKLSWVETRQELGSHSNTAASAVWTLDQVYEEARNNWLKKRDNANTIFEVNNNGMISACGYWEHGCMDGCFRGISIEKIEPL